MNWRSVGLVVLVALCLWLLALADFLRGNETAESALIGIPLGVVTGIALWWGFSRMLAP